METDRHLGGVIQVLGNHTPEMCMSLHFFYNSVIIYFKLNKVDLQSRVHNTF